jgi:protein ImuB
MQLWIGVYLPLLPLETFRPLWCDPGPHAVVDREQVLVMTREAARSGVRVGMRRGGVAAMAPDVILHERDAAREQAAFDSVAMTLLQYTPEVAQAEEASILLDVTASLSAFGGRLALCRRVRRSIDALGFTAQIGAAPTAQGAWLLAHASSRRRRAVLMATLSRRLDALPFALLPPTRPYHELLEGIGCRTLGDLRKLPRAGLQRRTSKDVLTALDRAHGNAPELFDWLQTPAAFAAKLELPNRIDHAEALLFAARRLIVQMVGWLVAQQLAVSRFVLLLEHERGRAAVAPTAVEISLAEPAWHDEHLMRLLKERLGRIELTAPVIALGLSATQLAPMAPPTASLFAEPGGSPEDDSRLLELLTARLGADHVLSPAPIEDFRPELGNVWTAASAKKAPAANRPNDVPNNVALPRPFWLLDKPIALLVRNHRPFYGSPLSMIGGPERIESGWWDGGLAMRDYFIAQGADAACYWIYRERGQQEIQWFLHGLFA